MLKKLVFAGLVALSTSSPISARDVTTANAEAAYTALMKWYNQTNGLWIPSTGWWNSANALTAIVDLAAVDSSLKIPVANTLRTTYTKAQQYNAGTLQTTKTYGLPGISGPGVLSSPNSAQQDWQSFLPVSHYNFLDEILSGGLLDRTSGGFLNG